MSSRLIVVCGPTGVGKSRLAIEIAQWLAKSRKTVARIINADAMQVYEGLDIITNKVPVAEQGGVEHLLMGFKKPGEQYVVGEWVRDAMGIIDETHLKHQVPVVVGGTAYWLNHLLFPNSLPAAGLAKGKPTHAPSQALCQSINLLPSSLLSLYKSLPHVPPSAFTDPEGAFALHTLLSQLDPPMAARWHWKDTRKVLRNLQIISEHGRPASEVIADVNKSGATARYRTLFFWLHADKKALDCRLDQRVDQMMEQGLLDEIRSLQQLSKSRPPSPSPSELDAFDADEDELDYTTGIYQSIGFKEFHGYLTTHDPAPQLYASSVDAMKRNTRKYAKRQVQWFRNKFLPAATAANTSATREVGDEDAISTFLLDATELGDEWEKRVAGPAISIAEAFLTGSDLPDPTAIAPLVASLLASPDKPTSPLDIFTLRRKITCPYCTIDPSQPIMLEEGREWERHQGTRSHKHYVRKNEVAEKGLSEEEIGEIERKRKERRERKASSYSHLVASE